MFYSLKKYRDCYAENLPSTELLKDTLIKSEYET